MNGLKVAPRAVTVSVILLCSLAASSASGKSAADGKSQLAFGVDMAKRGLWSEALFRFEQARQLEPQRVAILNNLAICYEAGGRFEEALATYREAARLAPDNRVVKQNLSRFTEFYQGYRPRKATPPPAAGEAPGPEPAAPPTSATPDVSPPSPPAPPPPAPPSETPPPAPSAMLRYAPESAS